LEAALRALGTAFEAQDPLAALIGRLESDLGCIFADGRIAIRVGTAAPAERGVGIALVHDGEMLGSLAVELAEPHAGESLATLRLLAAPIAAAVACRLRREERVELGRFARIDALCRIPNRLAFEERLRAAWSRCRERETTLAVALVDIDFFKAFNDRYGHVAGDRALRRVASLFAEESPGGTGMFAARYGGEEFVIIFEGIDAPAAFIQAQNWLEKLTALGIEHGGTTLGYVSASVGVGAMVPSSDRAPVELIEEADRCLYRAKNLGRNRICAGDLASQGAVVTRRSAARPAAASADPTLGRDADLARILAALRHTRTLTLVGPPGIGKSRLLQLVADAAKRQFERVILVAAERLRSGTHPAAAIASLLDLAVGPAGLLDSVTEALADQETLLLLDGGEDAASDTRTFCDHLLRNTPDVSLIAVAPAPLGLAGERAIVVPPLDDEAALTLLNRRGGNGTEEMRRVIRLLGGNPATIEETGGRIARFGLEATLAYLERGAPA
jgi:diguanylate cyclase (GGDEF)-like protein